MHDIRARACPLYPSSAQKWSWGLWVEWVVMGRMGNRSYVVCDFAVVSFVFFVSRVSCYFGTRGTRETIGTGARVGIILRCGVAVK